MPDQFPISWHAGKKILWKDNLFPRKELLYLKTGLRRFILMFGLLNLGSFLFGLASWIIPLVPLVTKKFADGRSMKAMFFSFMSVIIAFMMQMLSTKHLVDIEDWSALMDTQCGVVLAGSVLSIIVLILNSLMLYKSQNHSEM